MLIFDDKRRAAARLEQFQKAWSKLFSVGQNNPLQLRAISPKGAPCKLLPRNITFTASAYPNIADRKNAFEREALRLNGLGYNIYIVMNPIKPGFRGDENNEVAVKDIDIECRALLLIDIDRAHAVDPIHEDEVDDLLAFAFQIEQYLTERGYADIISVFSGNGIHYYLPLDGLPNDDKSKEYCQVTLRALASKFDSDIYKVDTSVYNAARITKFPGTTARKGIESDERPYQIAALIE